MKPILEIIIANNINLDYYLKKLKEVAMGKCKKFDFDSSQSLIALVQNFELEAQAIESIFSHLLIKGGYLTKKDCKDYGYPENNKLKYGYPANEIKIMIEKRAIKAWLRKIVFLNTYSDFYELAKKIDFHNDKIETIAKHIENLINISKNRLENLNEKTFGSILLGVFLVLKNNKNYTIGMNSSSGTGYLDLIIYFEDRADIYELKFILRSTISNAEKTLKRALKQIHEKKYMSTVIEKINRENSKRDINSIKLIPMLLCKMDSEADYQCKIGS